MGHWRWAFGLGAGLLLAAPAWAAPGTAENLDFHLSIESISWTATGFVVKAQIENRTGSPELFLHHQPNLDDPEAYTHQLGPTTGPGAAGTNARRQTFMLKGLTSTRTAAMLAFGVGADERAGLLIVGEARAPYRQVAIALSGLLPERPVAVRPAGPGPTSMRPDGLISGAGQPAAANASKAQAVVAGRAESGIVQRFLPPHASFGDAIVLHEGSAGPRGEGWTRLYTELPDITLDELKHVLERPAQIWRGYEGFLYVRNVGGKRALAVDVSNQRVISARYVTPQTLGQVMGPGTRYPKRVYMGRP